MRLRRYTRSLQCVAADPPVALVSDTASCLRVNGCFVIVFTVDQPEQQESLRRF
jgi:hypothetical protein